MFSRFTNRNRKPTKAQAWWEWNKPPTKAKRTMLRQKARAEGTSWIAAGGLLGALAGLGALFALKRRGVGKKENLARSGQPPGRSHIQIASHPAAQSRKG